jgi:5'-AMP-activated protein kinase catalytic alpha subunit
MASSLDLSGFFEDEEVSQRRIRFTSTHPPKDAFDKIESSATELGFQVQRGHSKLKLMRNCKGSKNPESFMVSAEVFELGPSVNVVELRKSNGDPALYRQLCERISSDMGARNTEQIFATASLEDDLQNSNAGTPLFAL